MQISPLPRYVNKVDFTALDCASINLHEFILCPGLCRGHTGRFWFFDFLFASSSKGFAVWFDPLLCADLADWWHSSDCLFFFGDLPHPACGKFTWHFLDARRAWQAPRVPGLTNQTPGWSVLFAIPLGVEIPLSWGSCRQVGVVRPHREVNYRGTPPSCQSGRWIIWSLCHWACTTPFGGISSVSKAPLAEINEQ